MENQNQTNKINIEDFKKIDLRLGQILSVEKVEGADKLLRLSVDLGEDKPRQIVSGVALFYPDYSVLINKKCMFVANLEPRVIRGLESDGMILAVSTQEGEFSLLSPNIDLPAGTRAK